MEMDSDYLQSIRGKLERRKEIMLERSKRRRNEGLNIENQLPQSDSDNPEDESPKRPCRNHVGEESNKENEQFMNDDFVVEDKSVKGLAALRQKHDIWDDNCVSLSRPKATNSNPQVNIRVPTSTKSRLASLTAHVRDWEDESCKRNYVTNPAKSMSISATNTVNSSFSNSFSDAETNQTFTTSTFNSTANNNSSMYDYSCQASFESSEPDSPEPILSVSNGKVSQKVRVWDQAIVSTLESQGFVKSTSTSKLLYDFSKKQESIEHDIIEEENEDIEEQSSDISTESAKPSFQEKQMANNREPLSQDTNSSSDPAELSLSARKALFERAFCGNQSKSVGNDFDTSLSVAQRAAMFEKGAKAPKRLVSPVKTSKEPARFFNSVSSPIKNISPIERSPQNSLKLFKEPKCASPSKAICSSTPKEVLSPAKNAASHTRLMQQQLIDSSSNDWKKNEISTKLCEERKKEISALFNHWERVSTSSCSASGTYDVAGCNYKKSSSSESEPFTAELPICEKVNDDSYEDEDAEDLESELEGPEETSCSNADDERSINSGNINEHAEKVFKELDNVLEAAVDSELSNTSPLASVDSKSTKSMSSSSSSHVSCNSSSSNTSHKLAAITPLRVPVYIAEDEPEREKAPLLHTISFYRRQQKEKRANNVQTIVRRQEVDSPPSPNKKPSRQEIEQKLQVLEAEVLAQQTVISQTSQALNLCQAAEEFSSSTERVEAERLLLIATQKRMACLNEIHQIKNSPDAIEGEGSGTLIIHDLKLPLKQDFISVQNSGKGNDAVHYFLCLVRHRHQVIVTQMISAQECAKNGSLEFSNHITLRNLSPDYSVMFEVWGLQTMKEKLSHDKKYHIKRDHNKMRLTPKSKKGDSNKLLSPVVSSPGGPNTVQKPSFVKVGFTQLTLNNSKRHACALENAAIVSFQSPLEGLLYLKMQLHVEYKVQVKGFLTMFQYVGDFGAWNRRWAVLNNSHIAFWKYPGDENDKEPILILDLKPCVNEKVQPISNTRKFTFQLNLMQRHDKSRTEAMTNTEYRLAADSKEECIMWCRKLEDALANIRNWEPNPPAYC